MNNFIKRYKYWILLPIIAFCLFFLFTSNNSSEIEQLKRNWDLNRKFFNEAKEIVSAGFSKNEHFYIEFKNNLVSFKYYSINNNDTLVSLVNNNKDRNDKKLLHDLGLIRWDNKKIALLEKILRKANLTSISNSDPSLSWWSESKMNGYSYLIFNENIDWLFKKKYNDSCHYLYYNDRVILVFNQ